MKTVKKVIGAVLAVSIALNLSACGANNVPSDPYMVLVNKTHKLPDNWKNQIVLVSDHDPWGEEVLVEQETWDYFEKERGEDYCKKYVAAPGYSEHQTGLAVDVCMVIDSVIDNDNDHMVANTELFDKVHTLMPEYGFILRYLPGKEDITGYEYEPWHLRYIGSPEIAKDITKKGITFEEYLGVTN